MTVETKTTIQANDIVTIEFECGHCHSISSWPLAVAQNPPVQCHCGHEQWMPHGGPDFVAITELIALLRRFRTAPHTPYIMRFGLAPSIHGGMICCLPASHGGDGS